MPATETHFGAAHSRVDGPLKVTGAARYAAEFPAADLAHGIVVSSAVARGRIKSIDTAAALAVPGVLQVFTHENRRATAWLNYKYRDEVAPPGAPFRPLYDAEIHYSGQPIALVVADDYHVAAYAASLLAVDYEVDEHMTALEAARSTAHPPKKNRAGIKPPPKPRGDAVGAFGRAALHVSQDYTHAIEHHNPMEPHASTVIWEGEGRITVHDKVQGSQNSQKYLAAVFGLKADDVVVKNEFVGGAFGSGLRPQYQLFLATMAALELERSVRVVLTRDQMFSFTHRPHTLQTVSLGADESGRLQSIQHDAVAATSRFEEYQEAVVNWSALVYHCENTRVGYTLADLDIYTPGDMRAPGAVTGMFALEIAMDEMAERAGIDPVELRLRNYAETDESEGKSFTSKELRPCYAQGAERIGWSRRTAQPRSMKEGREFVGLGVATGCWEAFMMKSAAKAVLTADGRLDISAATSDIGTGTYTILTQLAADALGLPMDAVTTRIGDSRLSTSPVEGGSWTAASSGSAVQAACYTLRETLLGFARGMAESPLANASPEHVSFRDGRVVLDAEPSRFVTYADALRAGGVDRIEAEETAAPSLLTMARYSSYTHSAVFAEVRVDEELGVVRVVRIVTAVAAGRIINPKTARSQIIGGVVMGLGMALHEKTMQDHTFGRFMNRNLAEYHMPANADVQDIDVIFVEEHDDKVSPIGVKGLGEIGIVGTAAAVANAIWHATGRRVRELPITIDKLL